MSLSLQNTLKNNTYLFKVRFKLAKYTLKCYICIIQKTQLVHLKNKTT